MNIFVSGVLFCAILVIVVLWKFSGRSNPNNKMLALSLIFICYALLINHLIFTDYLVKVPHLARTGLIAGNLIFPFLYLYVRNSFYPGKLWRKIDGWLFAPSVFYFIDLFPFFILSGQEKAKMLHSIYSDNQTRWRVDEGWLTPFWLHFLILYGMATFYWVVIVKMILKNQRMEGERISETNKPLFKMIVMLTASYFILTVPGLLGSLLNVTWFNVYFLASSLSITLFVVTIFLAFSPQVLYGFVYQPTVLNRVALTPKTLSPESDLLKVPQQMGKMYSNTMVPMKHHVEADKLHMETLFLEIDQYMNEKKPFLKQNLSIHELAAEIGIPVYALSKAINSVKGINYNKWLNQYRIAHFIVLYQHAANQQLTLEALAQKAGFISRITFIKYFKHEMGDTPAQYIKTYFKKDLA